MSIFGKMKQRYVRFRQRRLFIYIVTFIVLFSIGTGILAWIGIFGSRSELCSVKVSTNSNSLQNLQGLGVNLDYIPLNNYVKNSSFESEKVFDTFVLSDSKEDYIFMTPEEQENLILNENALIGSLARLYTIDERGVMSLIVESPITDYTSASFGSLEDIEDTNWYWTQDPLQVVASYQNVLSGVTDSGKLVTDISSGSFSKLIEAERDVFVGVDSSVSNVIAVTSKGSFYYSSDGKNYINSISLGEDTELYGQLSSGEVSIDDICAFKDNAFVRLSDGRLLICNNTSVYEDSWFDNNVKYVTSTDEKVYVVLTSDKVYSSTNGMVFNEEEEVFSLFGASRVKDVSSSSDASAFLLNDNQVVTVGEDINVIEMLDSTVAVRVFDERCLLGVLENGAIYIATPTNTTMLTGSEHEYENVFLTNDGSVILLTPGKLYSTNVYIGIKLEQHIPEGSVYAGDICCIEKSIGACQGYVYSSENEDNVSLWNLSSPVMSWDIYGNGTSVTTVEDAPVGYGERCARMLGTTDDYHVISQSLASCGSDLFIDNAFLRIELQLMQVKCDNPTVKIWLSSEGCEDVGFVVDECSSKFTRYSNVFIASEDLVKSENEIRLNIAFEGVGELRIDGVYMGLDKYQEPSIPQEFTDAIIDANPSAIRLNNLGIGSFGVSYDALFASSANSNAKYINDVGLVNNCTSLEETMRLVKDSGAFPWFVIGSSADQNSIDALLDYLCGSVTSEYGKRRIDNGTAVPWSRQFNTVIVEVNDADGIFLSDLQRSAYVNYVIGLFKQSSYYKDFKDSITFVDGMNYDGGSMLSFADYHCTQYVDDGVYDVGITYIDKTNQMYKEIGTLAPRVKLSGGQSGEYISSLDFIGGFGESNISLGECVVSLLADDSSFTRMILVDVNVDYDEVAYGNLFSANTLTMLDAISILRFDGYASRLYCEVQKPLSETAPVSVETFNSNVGTYMFKSGNSYYLVIANASDGQQQFFLDGKDVSMQGAQLTRYATTGEELQTETIKRLKNRYTLQAGQVLVIKLTE